MMTSCRRWIALGFCASLLHQAGALEYTNRLTAQARMGFNMSASFGPAPALAAPQRQRTTPGGANYNYDDGYVLTDISDNFGGQTWYWGYDDSARQISGDTILMSRAVGTSGTEAQKIEENPTWGGEVVYELMIPVNRSGMTAGLLLAGNYQGLHFNDNTPLRATLTRNTYPYQFTPGTTPPTATPNSPYQGTFEGPGFVVNADSGSPSITQQPGGALVTGQRDLEADLWGLRLGPTLEFPIVSKLRLGISGGAALGYLKTEVSWSEAATVQGVTGPARTGSGGDSAFIVGYFAGLTLQYELGGGWGGNVGACYQHLPNYRHDFGGRSVQVDLGSAVFITAGLSLSF